MYVIPKQDKQGVRKASEIEQKYNLNQDNSKIAELANSANINAERAASNAANALEKATQAEAVAEAANAGYAELSEDIAAINKRIDDIGAGGTAFTTDETLTLKNGVLSVNTANEVEADNTLPITSAAVHAEIGNIDILLQTI